MAAGDKLTFLCGPNGDDQYDSSALSILIETPTPPPPPPPPCPEVTGDPIYWTVTSSDPFLCLDGGTGLVEYTGYVCPGCTGPECDIEWTSAYTIEADICCGKTPAQCTWDWTTDPNATEFAGSCGVAATATSVVADPLPLTCIVPPPPPPSSTSTPPQSSSSQSNHPRRSCGDANGIACGGCQCGHGGRQRMIDRMYRRLSRHYRFEDDRGNVDAV